jgi:Kef-type K+ transport system membrane component KefB
LEPLVHLALIWAAVFVAVIAAGKTRLTPVLYYLALGCIMVNLGILPVEPEPFIEGFSEMGIILIMFAIGFEENTSNFLTSIKKSWGIAFFGALAPFLVAFSVAEYFWNDRAQSLMVGLTMTATAVSLTMVSLRSEGLGKSAVATRVMTSAVLDDIASLALVAILVPVATGEASLDAAGIILVAGKAVAFFALVSGLGLWVFPHADLGLIKQVPILGRYGMRHVLAFGDGEYATLTVLLLALVVGLLAHAFGFHPAVGAYMAGLILKEEYFHRRSDLDSYQDTRRVVDSVAFTWIGPVFFVVLGSKLVLNWDIFVAVLPQTVILLVGMFIGQVSSAALAARFTGGMSWEGSLMVGFGMLGRAELAFVVMNIAYVQNPILSTEAFYMLMFAAFWLNVAVPITIRLHKPNYERALAREISRGA